MRLEYTLELVNLFVGGYMLIKSALKALSVAAITSLFTVSTVHAYALTSMFETKHYGVYEVILEDVEDYDGNMKEIISRDIASKKKYQSTAAIFSHNFNIYIHLAQLRGFNHFNLTLNRHAVKLATECVSASYTAVLVQVNRACGFGIPL